MILVTFELFLNIFLAFFAILGYFRPPDYYSFLRSNCSKNKLLQYIHILIAFWTRNSMAILSRSPWPSNDLQITIHCTRGNLKKASTLFCKNDNFDINIFLVVLRFLKSTYANVTSWSTKHFICSTLNIRNHGLTVIWRSSSDRVHCF